MYFRVVGPVRPQEYFWKLIHEVEQRPPNLSEDEWYEYGSNHRHYGAHDYRDTYTHSCLIEVNDLDDLQEYIREFGTPATIYPPAHPLTNIWEIEFHAR